MHRMRVTGGFACTLGLALAGGNTALGQIWFADDFDSYGGCTTVPCVGCAPDQAAFLNSNWDPGPGSGIGKIESEHTATCPSGFVGWDEPFSCEEGKQAPYQAVRSLIPEIQTASDATRNAVNGTTANPLVITFHLYLQNTAGKPASTSSWLQLFAGAAPYSTAPIKTSGVSSCTAGVCVGGPMDGQACTTDDTCTTMKLQRSGAVDSCVILNSSPSTPRPSLALGVYGGANGLIPKPPCTNLTNLEVNHPVTFDGDAWWQIKSGSPPGSSGPDVGIGRQNNTIIWTIRETTMDVTVNYSLQNPVACSNNVCVGGGPHDGESCSTNSQCRSVSTTTTNIPRAYTGPLQAIAIGPGPVDDTLHDDPDPNKSFPVGSEYPSNYDDIEISGGEFVTVATGACCMPLEQTCIEGVIEGACAQQGGQYVGDNTTCESATCVQGACCLPSGTCLDNADPATCSSQNGTFHGATSTCADPGLLCCPHAPYVWADHDADGDVDMDDFGDFQNCYTGAAATASGDCKCYDRDDDGNVDNDDFIAFTNCVSGPSVPWNAGNLPSCVP